MNKITINASDFIRGSSSSDYKPDAGFSPEDKGHNLHVKEGLLYPQPVATNKGAAEDIFAWASVEGGIFSNWFALGYGGKFYSLDNDGVPTLLQTDGARTYSKFYSNMLYYKAKFYATSTGNIAQLDSAMGTATFNWWTGLGKTALLNTLAHHMIIFGGTLFISNGYTIASYDGTTSSDSAFTIDTNYYITAMIDYQNKIYIAAMPYYGLARTNANAKLFIFTPSGITTNTYDDSHPLIDAVSAFYVFKGTLLVFTEKYLAYWNGITLTKIKDLSEKVYKQQICQYGDRLYFSEGKNIVCYDGNSFYYVYHNPNNGEATDNIEGIVFDSNNLFISTGTKIYSADITTGAGTSYFRSNRFNFGQNVVIRKIVVELAETLVSGSSIPITFYDHKQTGNTVGTISYSAGDTFIKEFNNINITTYSLQLRAYFQTNGKPIKQFTIYYEPSEQPAR